MSGLRVGLLACSIVLWGCVHDTQNGAPPTVLTTPKSAHQSENYLGRLSGNPYDPASTSNPFGAGSPYAPHGVNNPLGPNYRHGNSYGTGGPRLFSDDGVFLGTLNGNRFDPNSVSNPYGRYGSRYSPDSINNPYGRYGSRYSSESATNPYGTRGPRIFGQR
jgi:hypothetical protein